MNKHLKLFTTNSERKLFENSENYHIPYVSRVNEDNSVHYNVRKYEKEYLTFVPLEAGTFTLTIGLNVPTSLLEDVSYSLDKGKTWTTVQNQDNEEVIITTPRVESYNNVLWKGNGISMSAFTYDVTTENRPLYSSIFSSTGKFNIEGNIMSLLYENNYINQTSFEDETISNFAMLFYSYNTEAKANVVSIENLIFSALEANEACYYRMFQGCPELTKCCKILPATVLNESCYLCMFYNCSKLISVPELPALTMAQDCYRSMFNNCQSLTVVPELPATTLALRCYALMFLGCIGITTPPELPALTLELACYHSMFSGCINLEYAPELPATILANTCYHHMFDGCTGLREANFLLKGDLIDACYYRMFAFCSNLEKAPDILATEVKGGECCRTMFRDCYKLNYIKALFLNMPRGGYTLDWVYQVASTGIFVKHIDATWDYRGNNAVPSNWTIIYYNPETDKYYLSDKTTECDDHGNVI